MNPDPAIWQQLLLALPAELALILGTLVDPRPRNPMVLTCADTGPIEFEFNGWKLTIDSLTLVSTGEVPKAPMGRESFKRQIRLFQEIAQEGGAK